MSSLGFVNDDSLLMISLLLWCLSILTCALARRPSAAYPLLSHSVLGFLCDNIDATWLTIRNDPMVYVRDAVIVRRDLVSKDETRSYSFNNNGFCGVKPNVRES